ncbi:MAG: GDP-mannose 4,6-dehydratase [Candidatus Ryanbacteria bacterium RIFCSPLOWO2_01_FULL_48_26]|uniref:GDP-mannose 4,6-dehydratase n=1 Tax=Candidatus Ryanbacteria bacterium RIFCSPLOWO2_01_FULL_48_26 TaxID=1802126 RepID=A0A1G2GSI1_9BACT|nr:MAG: GDP-mannose 4,6-dehydratase [Candidatus Ryanbacteria bacterium RIFCSPLOWO2_01_FULL_48_26]
MEHKKKALITGITGQDGSFLAELLLSKGYQVHGLVRRSSSLNRQRIDHLYHDPDPAKNIILYYGDLADASSIWRTVLEVQPDEIYHLGAQSNVNISFDMPEFTAQANALGTLRLLEAIKTVGKPTKFYMASSSEMFGSTPPPQNENSVFRPRSLYAISKVLAFHTTVLYREAYNLFAANGILFNHESERRGENFATRKITLGIAKIKAGLINKISMGNLEARRDWGYAPEFVEAMWRILQHEKPDDFVIATGESHSVREFVEEAFQYAGLGDWKPYVQDKHPLYVRPAEVDYLIGDSAKAKEKLGWKPKVDFKDLVKIMVDLDMQKFGVTPPGEGIKLLEERFPHRFWREV